MTRLRNIAFAIIAAIAAPGLPVAIGAQPGGAPDFFIPEGGERGGEHYDTVQGNYTRRCNSLSSQFTRARSGMADSDRLRQASALYEKGVGHCHGGARLQGIDELSQAIQMIGRIPLLEP